MNFTSFTNVTGVGNDKFAGLTPIEFLILVLDCNFTNFSSGGPGLVATLVLDCTSKKYYLLGT